MLGTALHVDDADDYAVDCAVDYAVDNEADDHSNSDRCHHGNDGGARYADVLIYGAAGHGA